MVTKVFDSHDTELYSTYREDGIVSLVIPDVGELRMSLTKAEDIAVSLASNAEFGRNMAKVFPPKEESA